MKRAIALFVPGLLLLGVAGCRAPSTEKIVTHIQEQTGVPVILKADPDDQCLTRQLRHLARQYSQLTPETQTKVIQTVKEKNLQQILLEPTYNTQTKEGRTIKLSFASEAKGGPEFRATKTLSDTTQTKGEAVTTIKIEDGVLTLQAKTIRDSSRMTHLYTYDGTVYDAVNDAHEVSNWLGEIRVASDDRDVVESCGAFVSLDDILALSESKAK